MKSINNISGISITSAITADDVVEFHAARLLLLIHVCGRKESIDGLTKMAKLDFFVRYPLFFSSASKALGRNIKSPRSSIESKMVRFHYGPWDHRYYRILAYLKAKGLVEYRKKARN